MSGGGEPHKESYASLDKLECIIIFIYPALAGTMWPLHLHKLRLGGAAGAH